MIERLEHTKYAVSCCDGASGLLQLPDRSIKLLYGSPPTLMQNVIMGFGNQVNILKKYLLLSMLLQKNFATMDSL